MRKKILLLGSGELGKEFVIACQRLGQYVIAIDNYDNAPAMQVAHECDVIDMLNGDELDRIILKYKPDIIVPEIESIRTERLYAFEKKGINVVPSAKAVNYTMNRKSIRDLAAVDLSIKTAKYFYASTESELREKVLLCGFPCVLKPLMSSSGKGQSIVRSLRDLDAAWTYAMKGSRGDVKEIIIEEFIDFEYEITLLTLTQNNGNTLFCPPIGHRQERGDYQESWQPMHMLDDHLQEAKVMAHQITNELGGSGIWGVEFFVTKNGPVFSELSPRPHDTGMVTLANTQNLSQFELHARAVTGIPVESIDLLKKGASAVILASDNNNQFPYISGFDIASKYKNTDYKIFGKPSTKPYRRMGVALAYSLGEESTSFLVNEAKKVASSIKVN